MAQLRTIEAASELRELVRELATTERDGDCFSMYVDLDPREYATTPARRSGIAAALDRADRAAPDAAWSPVLAEVRAAIASADGELDGAQGLLVYAPQADGEATIVALPRPVDQSMTFARNVPVRPLVEALPRDRWCVVLLNRRTTRVLVGDRFGLEQLGAFQDDVESQHQRGGVAQARFERTIEAQAAEHVKLTAKHLDTMLRAGAFERLLIAAPHELHGLIEGELGDQVRRSFCGFFDADVEHATTHDIATITNARIDEIDAAAHEELLVRLQQNLGRRERVAQGLDDVLAALVERRVGTLLVAEGFAGPGWVCSHGDWASRLPEACPLHGADVLEPAADIVEVAIEQAICTGAHVATIRRGPVEGRADLDLDADGLPASASEHDQRHLLLTQFGSIAALLRFDSTAS